MKHIGGKKIGLFGRRAERGQTILLVAISIVALLSMAALAVDVVTLYVAKSEIQRAADAVALAGAKAIADSGVTTMAGGDANLATAVATAKTMADAAIAAAVSANSIAGQPPQPPTVTYDFNAHGNNNPTVTVTLTRSNLPTFFARIWSRASIATQATAAAEVYNPQGVSPVTPIQLQCVKPWLVANCDPNSVVNNGVCATQIVNTATGGVEDLVGQDFYFSSACNSSISDCTGFRAGQDPPNDEGPANKTVAYLPAQPGSTTIAPTSCGNANQYQQSIAGCDPTPYSCGGGTAPIEFDPTENPEHGPNSDVEEGTSCLVASGDSVVYQSPWYSGPLQITAGSGPLANQLVSTSNAIATIPIIQYCPSGQAGGCFSPTRTPVEVVGFLQGFIQGVGSNPKFPPTDPNHQADVHFTVMNVVGCSTTANANPTVVGGNGASTIPVRLITSP